MVIIEDVIKVQCGREEGRERERLRERERDGSLERGQRLVAVHRE